MRYFTQYWKNETWFGRDPGAELGHSASNEFRRRGVQPGDRIYLVTVVDGELRLGGSLDVDRIVDQRVADAFFGQPVWRASDHVLSKANAVTTFRPDRVVPDSVVKRLRFANGQSPVFARPGHLDQQTMRGVRELSLESAIALDALLGQGNRNKEPSSEAQSKGADQRTSRGSINLRGFRVGDRYSRTDIARLGGVKVPSGPRDPKWSTGIVEFDNAVLFLVTLDKSGGSEQYAYEDYFDGTSFWWQSQNRQHRKTRLIQRLESGDVTPHLFVRLTAKEKGKTSPFTYCGRLSDPLAEGERPVTFLFESEDFVEDAQNPLAAIYEWKPKGVQTKSASQRQQTVRKRRSSGQGRQIDPRIRKAVERYAMEQAGRHYASLGFVMTDTSLVRPYDFSAKRTGETRRIEVKGTQGLADFVSVTVGEVRAARSGVEPTDLFIVFGVEARVIDGHVKISGGQVKICTNWVPGDDSLEPTEFRHRVPIK